MFFRKIQNIVQTRFRHQIFMRETKQNISIRHAPMVNASDTSMATTCPSEEGINGEAEVQCIT